MKLGIGVITHNRRPQLTKTIAEVQANTALPYSLVVADDGSTDDTAQVMRELRVTTVTGPNRGVAWNKNRALFLLIEVLRCDVVILLEDDAMPVKVGWANNWILAAERWGHVNLAGEWFADRFMSGAGTVDDPVYSHDVSGQCSVFSRRAIIYGGYLDSRFNGYGYGHVEHSLRLIRLGWGGSQDRSSRGVLFALLRSPILVLHPPRSVSWQVDEARNMKLCHRLLQDESYRAPWRSDAELLQFRAEIDAADLELSCT